MTLYQAEVYNRGTFGMCYFRAESALDATTAIYNQCKVGHVTFIHSGRVKPCTFMPEYDEQGNFVLSGNGAN
jgi:hypothetical protein